MPPGSAMLSSRAAMLTPSPKMSWGSTITSPILMPTRNAMRLSSTSPIVSSLMRALELHSSSDRFDRAWKLCQEPIAGVFHDAAAVFRDCGLDSVRQERCQFGMRRLFVVMHKSRIASHVGGQYRRQPALDPDWPLLHHGPQSNQGYCTTDQTAAPNTF